MSKIAAKPASEIKGIGIRGKMMVLFIIIPVLLIVGASLFYLDRMRSLSNLITGDSSKIVTKMAEQIITEKGRAVAREVKLYLETHPGMKREDFSKDPEFKKIAVQNVGKSGYTVIINLPTDTEPCRIWSHPNDKLVGADVYKAMRKKFGEEGSKGFIDIHKKVFKTQTEGGGYYRFLDDRDKYMVIVPIEGTDLFLPSTTYIDEFSQPVKDLQARANSITENTMRIVIIILVATTLLIATISFYLR